MNIKTLWVILGPTAIGKTELAIKIAEILKTEIISCDSRQFYKEMSIGTAIPSKIELNKIPHHFIQHKSIHEKYTVYDFEQEAINKIETLFHSYNNIIMTGGSGLYIDAICKGIDFIPNIDEETRYNIRQDYKLNGLKWLQEEVKREDLEYYQLIDTKNPQRLMRCLEVCKQTGKAFSSFHKKSIKKRSFKIKYIGLKKPRAELYSIINNRVDIMIKSGLVEEARKLLSYQNLNALQTVGYKELFNYLNGNSNLEESIELIKQNTRKFAKRQITWLKRYNNTTWYEDPLDCIKNTNKLLNYL